MSLNVDALSDMISRVRNAFIRGNMKLDIPFSRTVESVLEVLQKEKFVKSFEIFLKDNKKMINLRLLGQTIGSIWRVSKPSFRVYKKLKQVQSSSIGSGVFVLSTSKGVMSSKKAVDEKVGGEVLLGISSGRFVKKEMR